MLKSIPIGTIAVLASAVAGAAQEPQFETTRIADGVYQFRWVRHNAFFVVTPEGVVAFDPISNEAAAQYAREIRRVAPGQPLHAVVYSHSDADHATGAGSLWRAFGTTGLIIAHENAYPILRDAGNADLPPPNLTYRDRLTLRPGGRVIELHYLGRSHSDNMTVAYLPAERVAFAVDFVSNDRVGFRDLPGWYFPDDFTAMSRLLDLDFETVVFGHGPVGDRGSIHRQIQYYDDLRSAVLEAYRQGRSEDEAAEQVELPQWASFGQYEAWFPLNVRGMYRWIADSR